MLNRTKPLNQNELEAFFNEVYENPTCIPQKKQELTRIFGSIYKKFKNEITAYLIAEQENNNECMKSILSFPSQVYSLYKWLETFPENERNFNSLEEKRIDKGHHNGLFFHEINTINIGRSIFLGKIKIEKEQHTIELGRTKTVEEFLAVCKKLQIPSTIDKCIITPELFQKLLANKLQNHENVEDLAEIFPNLYGAKEKFLRLSFNGEGLAFIPYYPDKIKIKNDNEKAPSSKLDDKDILTILKSDIVETKKLVLEKSREMKIKKTIKKTNKRNSKNSEKIKQAQLEKFLNHSIFSYKNRKRKTYNSQYQKPGFNVI